MAPGPATATVSLGTVLDMNIHDLIPDLLNQKLQLLGPFTCVFKSSPSDSDAHSSLSTAGLKRSIILSRHAAPWS